MAGDVKRCDQINPTIHPTTVLYNIGIKMDNIPLQGWDIMRNKLPWRFIPIAITKVDVEGIELDPNTEAFAAI